VILATTVYFTRTKCNRVNEIQITVLFLWMCLSKFVLEGEMTKKNTRCGSYGNEILLQNLTIKRRSTFARC